MSDKLLASENHFFILKSNLGRQKLVYLNCVRKINYKHVKINCWYKKNLSWEKKSEKELHVFPLSIYKMYLNNWKFSKKKLSFEKTLKLTTI